MIITHLTGGLGNQMFQYAAGLALAERRRTVLKLDVSWFKEYKEYEAHNRYALSCLNITEQFATREEIDRVRGVQLTRTERIFLGGARKLRLFQAANRYSEKSNWHRAERFNFYPEFFEQPDGTYLNGMWQSERFFEPVVDILRLHFSFRYPPLPAVAQMAARIAEGGPSVAVHFRRGDYARNATFSKEIGVLGLDYYKQALTSILERVPGATLYIFSDDIDAIERDFKPACPHVFVRAVEHWHPHDKIRLMALCNHAVLSNSTFAWWGGWLNPSPGKIVISPDPWFSKSQNDGSDVIPRSWIRIPASYA